MATDGEKRQAALRAIDAFCKSEGFDVPPLNESVEWKGKVEVTTFIGEAPDGRRFYVGYETTYREMIEQELSS